MFGVSCVLTRPPLPPAPSLKQLPLGPAHPVKRSALTQPIEVPGKIPNSKSQTPIPKQQTPNQYRRCGSGMGTRRLSTNAWRSRKLSTKNTSLGSAPLPFVLRHEKFPLAELSSRDNTCQLAWVDVQSRDATLLY